jgi:hypothetical protein
MQILAGWTRVVAIGLVGAGLTVGVGRSQLSGSASQQGMGQQQGIPDPKDPFGQKSGKNKDDSPLGNNDAKMANARNDERQKRLVSDSDKLLELATQLHNDVAKTDQHILSVDVVKRAEEIEKLARSVKDRMKGT